MTKLTSFPSTHLILRLLGGRCDETLIPIGTTKCLLGIKRHPLHGDTAHCAIFRGPAGTVVRSLSGKVFVNGSAATVHWLRTGDRIEFPNSRMVEIAQLGEFPPVVDSAPTNLPSATETEFLNDHRFDSIELQIREIHSQNDLAQCRFNQVDDRLIRLVEQISELVSMAQDTFSPTPVVALHDPQTSLTFEPEPAPTPLSEEDHPGSDSAAPPVDDQLAISSNPISHSQDEEVESFLDSADVANEDRATSETSSAPADEQEPAEVTTDDAPEPAVDMQEESDADSSLDPVSETQTTSAGESVAELLERMKNEGQWGGLPADTDDEEALSETETTSLPVAPESDAILDAGADPSEEGQISDYMSELLDRMKHEMPHDEPAVDEQDSIDETPEPVSDSVPSPSPEYVEPTDVLRADEFVPLQKAEKIESLGAMRELANTSTRTALQNSSTSRQKTFGFVYLGIAISSFLMSVYFFLIASNSPFDTGFCLGILCVATSGFTGFRHYWRMKQTELACTRSPDAEKQIAKTQNPRSS